MVQLHNEYACGDKLNKETNNRMSTINGDGSWGHRKDRQLFGLENKREVAGRAFSTANCLAGDVPLDNCYVFDLPKSGSKNARQQQQLASEGAMAVAVAGDGVAATGAAAGAGTPI